MSIRVGPLVGPVVGPKVAPNGDVDSSGITWSVDATSGIAVPANSSEWTDLIADAGLSIAAPNSLWLCQEASGNLADSIGSSTLTARTTPNYQQTVTGWARKAVTLDNGTGDRFDEAVGTGPDPAATSQTMLGIINMPAATAAAYFGINTFSATAGCRLIFQATGVIRLQVMAVNTDGTSNHASGVHVFVVKYDRTNSAALCYTDLDKITGTYSGSVADGNKGFGSNASPAVGLLYAARWTGANAEISTANIKTLLQAMGYSISWS